MKTKVLYIAGAGRSGSTVLDRMLGEVDGFFSVGELRQIWDHAFLGDARCGCGESWPDCPFWQAVFVDQRLVELAPDPQRIIDCRDQIPAATLFRLARTKAGRAKLTHRMAPLLDVLDALYRAIAREANATVVVDSSKFSTYGVLLTLVESIDLHVIHLVRDARAQAFSWSRQKAYLEALSPTEATRGWLRANLTAQYGLCPRVKQRLRLRHEDVIRHPAQTLASIVDWVGEPDAHRPDLSDGLLRFGVNHTVGGNPDRFSAGETPLRLDERWRREMRTRDRLTVDALTWPWLAGYGYLGRQG